MKHVLKLIVVLFLFAVVNNMVHSKEYNHNAQTKVYDIPNSTDKLVITTTAETDGVPTIFTWKIVDTEWNVKGSGNQSDAGPWIWTIIIVDDDD